MKNAAFRVGIVGTLAAFIPQQVADTDQRGNDNIVDTNLLFNGSNLALAIAAAGPNPRLFITQTIEMEKQQLLAANIPRFGLAAAARGLPILPDNASPIALSMLISTYDQLSLINVSIIEDAGYQADLIIGATAYTIQMRLLTNDINFQAAMVKAFGPSSVIWVPNVRPN